MKDLDFNDPKAELIDLRNITKSSMSAHNLTNIRTSFMGPEPEISSVLNMFGNDYLYNVGKRKVLVNSFGYTICDCEKKKTGEIENNLLPF